MPAFYPEGDEPKLADPSGRSLHKINSLLNKIESKSFSIPEHDKINFSYDGAGRVISLLYLKNNVSVGSLSLQYNGNGNVISIVKT